MVLDDAPSESYYAQLVEEESTRTVMAARREHYLAEFNRRFTVPAAQRGHAFLPVNGQDLDGIFSVQQERVVGGDNTVKLGERVWQIEKTPWRGTLAGCRVVIAEHLDGRVTISYGPHVVGRYTAQGLSLEPAASERSRRKTNGFGGGLALPPARPPWERQNPNRTDHML